MKKFIFPLLLILTACHDNNEDEIIDRTKHPHVFQGTVAGNTLIWEAPYFTSGLNFGLDGLGNVSHGFYLMKDDTPNNIGQLNISTKFITREEFDSFFQPGEYEVGKDFFIRIAVNTILYKEKNDSAGILEILEVQKISRSHIRLRVKLNCQLITTHSYPVEETTLSDGTLLLEFKRYDGD